MELKDILRDVDFSYRADQIDWDPKTIKDEKAEIERISRDIANLGNDLSTANNNRQKAERNKDKAGIAQYTKEMKTIQSEIEKLRLLLRNKDKKLKSYQQSVTEHLNYIEKLSKAHPGLQEEFDSILRKKFTEKLEGKNGLKAKREALAKKTEPLQLIKDAASKSPKVAGMIDAIEELNAKIAEQDKILKDPKASKDDKSKAQILKNDAQKGLSAKKKNLLAQFKGKEYNGKVKPEDIDKLVSMKKLNQDLDKANRSIANYDQQIATYETALKNISKAKTDSKKEDREDKGEDKGEGKGGLPATKPKWYQFIKRFKNWYHKDDPIPEPEEKPEERPEEKPVSEEDKKTFRESMKFDVMRAYQKKLEQQYLHDAEAQNKEEAAKKEAEKGEDGPEL